MEAVRQIIDSDLIKDVISLPKCFQNKKVEVIIFLTEEKQNPSALTREALDEILKGSMTESLIGVLPNNSDMSLQDYRLERLNKYEATD